MIQLINQSPIQSIIFTILSIFISIFYIMKLSGQKQNTSLHIRLTYLQGAPSMGSESCLILASQQYIISVLAIQAFHETQ